METVFLHILNTAITAGWLALAVIVLRFLLKKAPKYLTVILWALVGVRLVLPFSLESVFSLIPSAQTVPTDIGMAQIPTVQTGVPALNSAINPILSQTMAPEPLTSIHPMQVALLIGAWVWVIGMVLMLLYGAVSWLLLWRKVRICLHHQDNIYLCDQVQTPFILGIFRPRIYLPSGIDEAQIPYVLAHEQAHLRRKDHWWKPLAFLLLAVHWFHPLLWVAYVLLCRDIEYACDEKVIRHMDISEKKGYSMALVDCSVHRRTIMACPLAFGEVGVKDRIQSVLHYKKPAFWIILVAILVCIGVAMGFLTNPVSSPAMEERLEVFLDVEICNHHRSEHSDENYCVCDMEVLEIQQDDDLTTVYGWVLYREYSYDNGLVEESGSHIPTVITARKVGDYYELVEYWVPGDGNRYAEDIRGKFPWHLHRQAMDSQLYISAQERRCEAKAAAFYGSLSAGTVYEFHGSAEYLPPTLTLFTTEQTFHFRYSLFSSYFAHGSYTLENDLLVLTTDDGYYTYVFHRKDDNFVFDAAASSPLPKYKYSGMDSQPQVPVPDGAVFTLAVKHPSAPAIPSLEVISRGNTVTAWVGTYYWNTKHQNVTSGSISADSPHPLSCLESVPGFTFGPSSLSSIDPRMVTLQFSQIPSQVTVRAYPIDSQATALGISDWEALSYQDGYVILKDGVYLYEVIAQFNTGATIGTVHYAFQASPMVFTPE